MSGVLIAFLVGIFLSIITVLADVLIKNSSLAQGFSGWKYLLIGAIIYGLTAFGWFFTMRKIKLSTLGVLYGISCIVLLTLVSVFYFKEKISGFEIFGIVLAIAAILILARFA